MNLPFFGYCSFTTNWLIILHKICVFLTHIFHISKTYCLSMKFHVSNLTWVHNLKQSSLQNGTKWIRSCSHDMGMTFIVDTSPLQFPLFLTAQPCVFLNVWMYIKNVMPDQCQCKLALFERCSKSRFSLQFENLPQPAWFSIHQSKGRLEQIYHSSPDGVMWAPLDVHVIPDGSWSVHTC